MLLPGLPSFSKTSSIFAYRRLWNSRGSVVRTTRCPSLTKRARSVSVRQESDIVISSSETDLWNNGIARSSRAPAVSQPSRPHLCFTPTVNGRRGARVVSSGPRLLSDRPEHRLRWLDVDPTAPRDTAHRLSCPHTR